MNQIIWVAIIAAFPGALAAVLGFINARKLGDVHSKVNEVEIKVDGRLTELLELTRTASKAEGVVEGKESNDLRN